MRYYLDEDLSARVAVIARARGLDVVSSHECGRDGLPDIEQLQLAGDENRTFVTRNRDDFIALTARFFEHHWLHAGLVIVPRSLPNANFRAIATALLRFDREHQRDTTTYAIYYLVPG